MRSLGIDRSSSALFQYETEGDNNAIKATPVNKIGNDLHNSSCQGAPIALFLKRMSIATLMLFTGALPLVFACGDSEPKNTEVTPVSRTEIEVAGEEDARASSNDTDPRFGGVLVFPAPSCGIPDPAIDPVLLDGLMVGEIHAGLTRIGSDPSNRVDLELAEKYVVREQGIVYDFTLRPDLRFSDGSPISASDFKWSWERAIGLAVSGSDAERVFGPINGFDAIRQGDTSDLVGVKVIDDRTLRVTLQRPTPHFTMLVSHHVASVLSRENVENWNVSWTNSGTFAMGDEPFSSSGLPVSAGPFRVSKYDPRSEECQLRRNEHYWSRDAYIDGVIFDTEVYGSAVDEIGSGDDLFVAGEIDYIDSIQRSELPIGALELDAPQNFGVEYLLLNPSLPPLDNVHFRRSIIAASPDFYALERGDAPPPETFNVYRIPFDTDMAQNEAQECQCAESYDEVLSYPTDLVSSGSLLASAIFPEWDKQLGISVQSRHTSRLDIQRMVAQGTVPMVSLVIRPSYPDPSAVALPLLDAIPGGYESEIVEELRRKAESAVSELDQAKRIEKWRQLEDLLLDAALVLPIAQLWSGSGLVQEWVNGLNMPEFDGSMFYDVWLDGAPERVLD